MSTALDKPAIKRLLEKHTSDNGIVQQSSYISEHVRRLRGGAVTPEELASIFRIPEPKARAKALRVMRRNLDQMIGYFLKVGPGGPRLQTLRADAPLGVIVEQYEWYQDKCIRGSARLNARAVECGKRLKKLRKQRAVEAR